ncbi:hypothetical protein GmHk_12G035505 [Glycine max]|nr:hypothetical protein GmHk_12G035505 [Glycine max]
MIYLTWLWQNFQELPVNVDDVVIAQHARAHIMMSIGGCLMSDTSEVRDHFMYLLLLANFIETNRAVKPLQIDIEGCLLLLQSRARDHIKHIVPHIDDLYDEEVQQGLGFPLARRWSQSTSQRNILTHAVILIQSYLIDYI